MANNVKKILAIFNSERGALQVIRVPAGKQLTISSIAISVTENGTTTDSNNYELFCVDSSDYDSLLPAYDVAAYGVGRIGQLIPQDSVVGHEDKQYAIGATLGPGDILGCYMAPTQSGQITMTIFGCMENRGSLTDVEIIVEPLVPPAPPPIA